MKKLISAAAIAAACLGLTAGAVGPAGAVASPGDTVNYSVPVVASSGDTVNYSVPTTRVQSIPDARDQATPAAARDPLPVNRVKVRDALLRSQPNRNSTKLDVSQPGRGLTLYCWVDGGPGDGGYIWFKTHPWGSRYTGWMRGDLIHWGSYPNPRHC